MRGTARKVVACAVALALPVAASAGPTRAAAMPAKSGPIKAAVERAGRDIAGAQAAEARLKGRLWTSLALIIGGGALTAFGIVEASENESAADSDDGPDEEKDSDTWNKVMLGGGIAAAALGSVLLMTGKKGPSVALKRDGFAVRQTFSF